MRKALGAVRVFAPAVAGIALLVYLAGPVSLQYIALVAALVCFVVSVVT